MIISALKSNNSTDNRSPIHKETISTLINLGIEIWFEDNIGEGVNTSNEIFQELGLKKHSRNECLKNSDLVITNQSLNKEEVELMKKNATILGMVNPFSNQELIETCYKSNINLVSMEFIPRITRAQKMDVLSSQANLAGYVAVIEAAKHLSTALPMMMTAAGTLKPAKVFVIGVGVAGLQAIATAKRLGARVEAFDTRDVVEEQVNSLGAKFVKIDLGETGETDQGYAKELTEEQIKMQKELQSKVCEKSDIVITTAQLFGRPAPQLIDNKTIDKMIPGSVIFDMAVESGGNVEGSQVDEIIERNGVKIIGISNLASRVSSHASLALSNNYNNWIIDFFDKDSLSINFDFEDEIIQSSVLVYGGKIMNERFK
ncbi:MAG: NAD(P) transhydrogenase subunit alpha [Gammaproteobacteria bacterium]